MKKTFWSVQYNNIGQFLPLTAWFSSKDELDRFCDRQDGCDQPVAHRYSAKASIREAEAKVLGYSSYRDYLNNYNSGAEESKID